MELGDSTTPERHQRSVVDEALDTFDAALTDLISAVETSGLDRLEADQQVVVWQRLAPGVMVEGGVILGSEADGPVLDDDPPGAAL